MQATYREIDAKTVTRLRGFVDPWFLARYGMNLYRGCEHGCVYCDGRAERYYVEGDFARDIVVKRNAVQLLRRELARRKEPGFVFLGGGVCDAYQPAEARYRLSRGVLEIALSERLPVHVLTKSALVERDLDLLSDINAQSQVILSFSLQTIDDAIRLRFEPGAASVSERLRVMRRAKDAGMAIGVMAMPVLPGISDQPDAIEALVRRVADAGADFVCFGALTLRPGIQKQTYLGVVGEHDPRLLEGYRRAYANERPSGAADSRYTRRVHDRFATALGSAKLPSRVPHRFFRRRVPLYAEVAVLLEHEDAARGLRGERPMGLGAAGWALQKWAYERLSKANRRAAPGHVEIEREFARLVALGSALELGLTPLALSHARRWLTDENGP